MAIEGSGWSTAASDKDINGPIYNQCIINASTEPVPITSAPDMQGRVFYLRAKREKQEGGEDTMRVMSQSLKEMQAGKRGKRARRAVPAESISASNAREQVIYNIVGRNHSTIEHSRLDIAGMAPGADALLMFIEAKLGKGDFNDANTQNHIRQTISYSAVGLAYGRWGMYGDTGAIVSLLLYPSCVYRISLSKATDAKRDPFGFYLKLERAVDPIIISYVVWDYIGKYVEFFNAISERRKTQVTPVRVSSWAPINFKFEREDCVLEERKPSLGFLFKTDSSIVKSFLNTDRCKIEFFDDKRFQTLHRKPMIVKVLSAVLVRHYNMYCEWLARLCVAVKEARVERDLEKEREEVATLRRQLEMIRASRQNATNIDSAAAPVAANIDLEAAVVSVEATNVPAPAPVARASDTSSFSRNSLLCDVVLPYVGIIRSGSTPVLIMEYMGPDLVEAMKKDDLRGRWVKEMGLRQRFVENVGWSILSITAVLNRCNNDWRLRNCAFNGSLFCPIDLDMCAAEVAFQFRHSSILRELIFGDVSTMMLVSTIQIIIMIFFLDGNLSITDDDYSSMEIRLREHILEGAEGSLQGPARTIYEDFSKWLQTKGKNVEGLFVPKQQEDVAKMDITAFMQILRQVVGCEDSPAGRGM